MPPRDCPVDLSDLGSPRFVLTVDTEEEFDWGAPFSRSGFGLGHVRAIPRFQAMCEERGVVPSYLIDYPIASNRDWIELLGGYAADSRAEIGIQLHPWVSPPFSEAVSQHNSYACNLPADLEREKLTTLCETIVANMGVQPDSYRAGRYGAGPSTPDILTDLGVAIDTSVRARFDYRSHHGPDYSRHPVNPYWIKDGQLLELPLTTIFAGALRGIGDLLFGSVFASQSSRSLLARTAMLERIALTPEGIPAAKAIEAIDLALEQGLQILNLSFHSPSLEPGHTPYVRNESDLIAFYDWLESILTHLQHRGVRPTSMAEIKAAAWRGYQKGAEKLQMPLASAA